MLQDDYILRQIREMVRAVMKMLFQVSAPELTPEVIEDKERKTDSGNLLLPLPMKARLTKPKTDYTK